MELFSEIYSCYYQVLRHLLCRQKSLTIQEISNQIRLEGFEESLFSIIPKLESGAWNFFQKKDELYLSKIDTNFLTPVSYIEKSYLKALISDPRIELFLKPKQSESLKQLLAFIPPLWTQDQFYYFDQFTQGDPYQEESYRHNFQILLQAQKEHRYVEIDYTSPKGNRVHHYYAPARLEYSVKNDKFRLLAIKKPQNDKTALVVLNVARMQSVRLTDQFLDSEININDIIRNSYYKDPLKLHIVNKRNALERTMLHFANYEKNTTKIDENTYECLIYYNQNMETELLIEVMSFGPMVKVIGNDKFLSSLKARLQRQIRLFPGSSDEVRMTTMKLIDQTKQP
ncbi:MAG: WYL domain-containing protein [Lachnospiraceae bacterium]|jgi:hypothetical protein|nr:WYL domain-containing protein [Lachnospiraceae bacterium]